MNYTSYLDHITYEQLTEYEKNDPILVYLAHFNVIDKYFDKLLKQDKFLPYNEKIKRIITGNYYISWFVKLHEYQLKYFGEVRNHIIHGVKMDGKTYVLPTPYALEKLERFKQAIVSPPNCLHLFKKNVYTCFVDDHLKDVLVIMKKNGYSHVPVYKRNGKFAGLLTEGTITYRLADHFSHADPALLEKTLVQDLLAIHQVDNYLFVSQKMNIYEVDEIFTLRRKKGNILGAMFITKSGKPDDPILGMITGGDVALVDMYVIH